MKLSRRPVLPSRPAAFVAAGIVLALGAPAGFLALRFVLEGGSLEPAWFADEFALEPVIYGYLLVATTAVFAVLGWVLGRLVDALERRSTTDPLTGLLNRRAMEQRLDEEVNRARRYRTPLAMLFLDLDGLKELNDSHGHQAGDQALRLVAESLRRSCRASDLVARVGGDEFVVIAPSTGPRALRLAERIRVKLRHLSEGGMLSPLSVSIGVAECRQQDAASLYAAADRALYLAKASGRNRAALVPVAPAAQSARPAGRSLQ